MDKLTHIIAAVEHPDTANAVIDKAVALACTFDARVELLVIDPLLESGFVPHCMGLNFPDLTVRAAPCAGEPVHALLLREVSERQPDLLIKAPAGAHPLRRWRLTPNDWQLSQRCPVPLMLATAKSWAKPVRFAASIDVSDVDSVDTARSVLHAAGFLALGCHGNLDVLYTERELDDDFIRVERAVRLAQLVREYHVGCERLQMFDGAPDKRLPPLIASRQYDLLLLGSVSHRHALGETFRSLSSRLAEATEGDVVLVRGQAREQKAAAPGVVSRHQQVPDECQQFV